MVEEGIINAVWYFAAIALLSAAYFLLLRRIISEGEEYEFSFTLKRRGRQGDFDRWTMPPGAASAEISWQEPLASVDDAVRTLRRRVQAR